MSKARASTPAELVDGIVQLLNFSTMLLALAFDEDELQMRADEARNIALPAARMLAKTRWAKLAAKRLAQSSDAIALIFAVLVYTSRVAPAVRKKVQSSVVVRPIGQDAGGDTARPAGASGSPAAGFGGVEYSAYGEPPQAGADLDYSSGIEPLAG